MRAVLYSCVYKLPPVVVFSNCGVYGFVSEPVEWLPTTQIQEQQRLAEAVGGLHQLLSLLLQNLPG